ncbi:unnamed protein product, partial [Iphiclides podalirius]
MHKRVGSVHAPYGRARRQRRAHPLRRLPITRPCVATNSPSPLCDTTNTSNTFTTQTAKTNVSTDPGT